MNQEQLITAIRQAHAAGDKAAVQRYGAMLMQPARPAAPSVPDKLPDPTDTMSNGELFLAGVGKGMTDLARGAGQVVRSVIPDSAADRLGLPTKADIDEVKRMDAPLLNTAAGTVGNVTGTIAATLPTMFIPGAQGFLGASAVGAGTGALQPVGTDDSRFENAMAGGAGAAAGVAAGRLLAAGAKGGKALLEPFYPGGRDKIVSRTMNTFGLSPDDLKGVTSAPTVTGSKLTLAETLKDPRAAAAAARLQDAARTADPATSARMLARQTDNNAARVGTLRSLAGTDGARDAAANARQAAAGKLYGKAFGGKLDFDTMTQAQQDEIVDLMNTSAVKQALKEVRERASNAGLDMSDTNGSVEGLHMMKLVLDDMANSAGKSASEVNKAQNIRLVRDRFVKFVEDVAPDYDAARRTYATMSRPVNQMDTAAELLQRGAAPTHDLAGNPRLMPDAMMRAVSDEPRLIKLATGRDIPDNTLSKLMEPDQLVKMRGVIDEVDRLGAVERAGNGPGSGTAQRLAANNFMRQTLGPTGMPQSWAESTLLSTLIGRPLQFVYNGVAEPRIQRTLADILLDPAAAAALAQRTRPLTQRLPSAVQGALPAAGHAMRLLPGAVTLSGE